MKKSTLAFVGALVGMLGIATSANAGFIVNTSAISSAGGFDTYTVRVFNDATAGTGTRISGMDVTLQIVDNLGVPTSAGPGFTMNFQDVDLDSQIDANINGSGLAYGSSLGTFMRIGTNFSANFFMASHSPSPYASDSDNDPETPGVPFNPAYNNLHTLNVAGAFTAGGGQAANTGTGTGIANIVVPTGTFWALNGGVGGGADATDIDPKPIFATNVPIPEPASMGLLVLGAMGLLGSRRRA